MTSVFDLLGNQGGFTMIPASGDFIEAGKQLEEAYEDIALSKLVTWAELVKLGCYPADLMTRLKLFLEGECQISVASLLYIPTFSIAQPVIMTEKEYHDMMFDIDFVEMNEKYRFLGGYFETPKSVRKIAEKNSLVLTLIEMGIV